MLTHFYLIQSICLGSPKDHQVEANLKSVLHPLHFTELTDSLRNGSNSAERFMPPSAVDTLWLDVVLLLCGFLVRSVEGML